MRNTRFNLIPLILILVSGMVLVSTAAFCGNKDRSGQAGAYELLINPWARSSGWGGANMSTVTGLEAMHLNVAGMVFTRKTEVLFSRTNWLSGSGVNLNAFGFTQRVGEQSVIGLGIMSMDFGDIPITTVNLPEGGLGTYSPQYMTLGVSYAREFSNSIYGGLTMKTISEGIADASTRGVCFDAGIRYITGEREQVKFGIALKNVGPKMQYSGDGLSTKVLIDNKEMTVEQRAEPFELPSLLNIGASYDFYLNATTDSTTESVVADHRITAAGTFTSNSFGKDQIRIGAEYGFKKLFMIRTGYVYEEGITKTETNTSAHSGLTAGASVVIPLGKGGNTLDLDYSFRSTVKAFGGTHSIGLRINI